MTLRVKLLSENATLPVRGSLHAAGYDLSAASAVTIPAGGKGIAKTDLAIAVPDGTYGRIAPRSGLAWKKHIDGNVGVVLFNHGKNDLVVQPGDRVAQLILERIVTPEVLQVESLEETERGAGGFGSTGVSASEMKKRKLSKEVLSEKQNESDE
eukprot:g3532.t1